MKLKNDREKHLLPLFSERLKNMKGDVPEKGPARISFEGYSGAEIDLSDYGFDHPVVYDIATLRMKNTIPILYKHGREIGHTVDLKRPANERIVGRGLLSVPNDTSKEVTDGIRNQFPYQASMGVDANLDKDVEFLPKGRTVLVNGRTFNGPKYIVRNGKLSEMTVTVFARDPETKFEFLNEANRMRLKNSAEANKDESSKDDVKETLEGKKAESNKTADGTTSGSDPDAAKKEAESGSSAGTVQKHEDSNGPDQKLENQRSNNMVASKAAAKLQIRTRRLMNQYPEELDLIEKCIDEDWDDTRLENEVKLRRLDNGLPQLPNAGRRENATTAMQKELECRLALSLDSNPEFLEKKFGKETVEKYYDAPMMTLQQVVCRLANSTGGRFDGYSDLDAMAEHVKQHHFANQMTRLNNGVGFSTVSLANVLENVSRIQLEERWALNPPFAPRFLAEESNKDFRKTQKMRVTAGEVWEKVKEDGTIKHTTMGDESFYTSGLDTVGQLLTITRPMFINDDMDVLRQLMEAMLEGAMMVPDMKLGVLLFKAAAAGTFWVDTDNSHTSSALTRANLSTRYNALRTYDETRGSFAWKNMINDRFTLVIDPTKEETAFDIVKQEKYVSNTTANTLQPERNYWYNKVDLAVFPQMANQSLFGNGTFVSANTWFLWPSSKRFSPYTITYLKGRKRPTVQAVDMPSNILGSGIRGFWDVEVNERERMAIDRNNG